METKSLFGWLFITFGIATFLLPDHPKMVNCFIMVMYVVAMIWWARWFLWWDVAYWFFACGITYVVTFGLLRRYI